MLVAVHLFVAQIAVATPPPATAASNGGAPLQLSGGFDAARRPSKAAKPGREPVVITLTGEPVEQPAPQEAFSSGGAGRGFPEPRDPARAAAQRRMDGAVKGGLNADRSRSTSTRSAARQRWDDAAEQCRRTPGCVPVYRDGSAFRDKPLKTDAELVEGLKRRLDLSGSVPGSRHR